MNIEECIEQLKDLRLHCLSIGYEFDKDAEAIEWILTAYEEKSKELEKEKEKNNKIEKELEKHIEFCEQEAEGSLNNEICHISLRFNKRLLDIINEEE